MPGDLFGDVTDPSVRVGGRKWYTVPLSLAAHACVLLAMIVIPLMATGMLPAPAGRGPTFVSVEPPSLPEQPPVRRATEVPRRADVDVVPLEPPSTIEPESSFEEPIENSIPLGSEMALGNIVSGGDALSEPPPPKPAAPPVPVRAGITVRAPVKVQDAAPAYPAFAQVARIEGVVVLEATIGVDGRVQDVRVLRSIPLLDQAALSAVRQWIYTPTLLNGVPVPVIMTVTVHFQLK